MKTIITKIPVLCLIFLVQSFLKAQNDEDYVYRGGNADGFATEKVEDAICATPINQVAYFGGNGDGSASETIADNASCDTPFNQFAYYGGNADGASTETLQALACDTPLHFYAYFGGEGDGSTAVKTGDVCPIVAPVADFTSDITKTCVGESVKFTDTSTNQPTGWTWTFQGGTPATASTKTVNVSYDTPGIYEVKLVAANYIGSNTVTKMAYITVVQDCATLGTSAVVKNKVQIYPNPTKNMLYLKSDETILKIILFDASGRKVMESKANQKEPSINLERLNSGLYMMKTTTSQGEQVYKVIKRD